MELAMSKTREQFPLSEKKPLKKTLPTIINCVVLFILLFGGCLAFVAFTDGRFNLSLALVISLVAAAVFAAICSSSGTERIWHSSPRLVAKTGIAARNQIKIEAEAKDRKI